LGSHDGYAHLQGHPHHERRWQFDTDTLEVFDNLTFVPTAGAACARFHLAPGLRLDALGAGLWRVLEGGDVVIRIEVLTGHARATSTQHALRFGVLADAATLEVTLQDGRSAVRISWGND
jgi:hypothetical protein